MEAGAQTLDGSAYLGDLAACSPVTPRSATALGCVDSHVVARDAIEPAARVRRRWGERPVFLYGFDDLTRNQLEPDRARSQRRPRSTWPSPTRTSPALAARASLFEVLCELARRRRDPARRPNPSPSASTPLLFHLEREFGNAEPARRPAGDGLVFLRSAGERGEAEAIAVEVARLLADGVDPAEIAIGVRDPERRGPLLSRDARVPRRRGGARGRGPDRRQLGRRSPDRIAGGGAGRRARERPAALHARPVGTAPGAGRLVRARRSPPSPAERRRGSGVVGGALREPARRPGANQAGGRRKPLRAGCRRSPTRDDDGVAPDYAAKRTGRHWAQGMGWSCAPLPRSRPRSPISPSFTRSCHSPRSWRQCCASFGSALGAGRSRGG